MPEVYLKQLGFTYSVCGLFIKKKRYKNLKKEELRETAETNLAFSIV